MKKYANKNGQKWNEAMERAPLELSIDPQFDVFRSLIKQEPLKETSKSIYDEVDRKAL